MVWNFLRGHFWDDLGCCFCTCLESEADPGGTCARLGSKHIQSINGCLSRKYETIFGIPHERYPEKANGQHCSVPLFNGFRETKPFFQQQELFISDANPFEEDQCFKQWILSVKNMFVCFGFLILSDSLARYCFFW